jgi:uncharacterized protein with GYD domain
MAMRRARNREPRSPRCTSRRQEARMATYVVLMNFTEQGIKNVKESPARYEAARASFEKHDIKVRGIYWTVGAYDLVLTIEGSDEAMTGALLRLGAQGNVRTQTLRAFGIDEMKGFVAKM